MGWRRRRRRSGLAVTSRLEPAPPSEVPSEPARGPAPSGPAPSRPGWHVPPGESRYHRTAGLRARLDAIDDDDELRVTIDLTDLRNRTLR